MGKERRRIKENEGCRRSRWRGLKEKRTAEKEKKKRKHGRE
jgi:hypothetical protein